MIIVNTETIAGKEIIESLGIVRGNTVRARNLGRDIFAGLKNLVGGEISEYTKLLSQAREEALERMINDAKNIGANAVVVEDFPDNCVIGGVPAKIIGKYDKTRFG